MRNNILNRLLLVGAFALTIGSCDREDPTSMITSFEKYPLIINTPAVLTEEENAAKLTLNFDLDDKQITDIVISVGVGSSSTATEGVDFELSTHEIELAAFEGQDGFSIDVQILQDFEVEDGADEKIYLTFTTVTPSGLSQQEVLVATIEDSGLEPQPGETVDFTLRWGFTDSLLSQTKDICEFGMDVDMTFQTAGTAEYDDDLLGFAAASTDCPEVGTLDINDMNDGEVYDVWVLLYAGLDFGDLSGMTIFIDYERENSDFHGTFAIEDVFNTTMTHNGGPMLTIERHGDVLTLKDGGGTVVSSGRVKGKASNLRPVTKRK